MIKTGWFTLNPWNIVAQHQVFSGAIWVQKTLAPCLSDHSICSVNEPISPLNPAIRGRFENFCTVTVLVDLMAVYSQQLRSRYHGESTYTSKGLPNEPQSNQQFSAYCGDCSISELPWALRWNVNKTCEHQVLSESLFQWHTQQPKPDLVTELATLVIFQLDCPVYLTPASWYCKKNESTVESS